MRKNSGGLPEFGFLIYDIGRLMRSEVMERLSGLGMTEAQWRAVAHLSRMEGCRQVDLAQALQVRAITLARVIDRLEAAGYVKRVKHQQDRRAVTLHLTNAARPVVAKLRSLGGMIQDEALADFSASERKKLTEMLETIRGRLASGRPAQDFPDQEPA